MLAAVANVSEWEALALHKGIVVRYVWLGGLEWWIWIYGVHSYTANQCLFCRGGRTKEEATLNSLHRRTATTRSVMQL